MVAEAQAVCAAAHHNLQPLCDNGRALYVYLHQLETLFDNIQSSVQVSVRRSRVQQLSLAAMLGHLLHFASHHPSCDCHVYYSLVLYDM